MFSQLTRYAVIKKENDQEVNCSVPFWRRAIFWSLSCTWSPCSYTLTMILQKLWSWLQWVPQQDNSRSWWSCILRNDETTCGKRKIVKKLCCARNRGIYMYLGNANRANIHLSCQLLVQIDNSHWIAVLSYNNTTASASPFYRVQCRQSF